MTSPALTDFGKAVRKARTAQGWTLEMLAHEALGNQERKSYVSAVERGKKRLSPLTIQKFARVLDLDDAVVDPALDHAAPQDDPTSQPERDADRLYDEMQVLRQSLKISESLAIALAVKHAEGNPSDLAGALRELERAFEVANAQAQLGALPSNTDAAVDAVIAEVDRLNEDEGLEAGSAYVMAELDRVAAQHVRLIDKGLAQAVLARDVDGAVALELRKLRLEGATDAFEALRKVQDEWYVRGCDKGLAFDLEVSIGLAKELVVRQRPSDNPGGDLIGLGNSLCSLGERSSDTNILERALETYRVAATAYEEAELPSGWANAQIGVGNALLFIGERESGTARLEQAIAAFRAALKELTREQAPLDWATSQNNLGNALRALGQRESGTTRLEESVAAYRAALKEWTREKVPLDWAGTQNNLGTALQVLGIRESDTPRLEEAVAAFRAALKEWTRDRVPHYWAITQNNLAEVEVAFFDKTGDVARLDRAQGYAEAAREVFVEGGASHYVELVEGVLAGIAERRGGVPG